MKKMNKKIVVLLTALLMLVGSSKAQVFISDDEFEGMLRHGESEYVLVAPAQGLDTDQYTPVGHGLLFFTLLSGSYLLVKGGKTKARNAFLKKMPVMKRKCSESKILISCKNSAEKIV